MSILESEFNQSVRIEKWCQKLASRVVPIKDGTIYHFSDHSFYEVNQKPVLPIVKLGIGTIVRSASQDQGSGLVEVIGYNTHQFVCVDKVSVCAVWPEVLIQSDQGFMNLSLSCDRICQFLSLCHLFNVELPVFPNK